MHEGLETTSAFSALVNAFPFGMRFDARTTRVTTDDGRTAKEWAESLAQYTDAGLLVIKVPHTNPELVCYGFARQFRRGRVQVSSPKYLAKLAKETTASEMTDQNLATLIGKFRSRSFTLFEASVAIGETDDSMASVAIKVARRRMWLSRDDASQTATTKHAEPRFIFDLDEIPQERFGGMGIAWHPAVGPSDRTRFEAVSEVLRLRVLELLVERFYGLTEFTFADVMRITELTQNKQYKAHQLLVLPLANGQIQEKEPGKFGEQSTARAFAMSNTDREVLRIAMEKVEWVWGETKCHHELTLFHEDPNAVPVFVEALRGIACDEQGWFLVDSAVVAHLVTAMRWNRNQWHQLFVERFLELLAAATPPLLEIRLERASVRGTIQAVYCRACNTHTFEGGEEMSAENSQTSYAEDLTDVQILHCRKVFSDLFRSFWEGGTFKVSDIAGTKWFSQLSVIANIDARQFGSFLVRDNVAVVTSSSYKESDRRRNFRFARENREVWFFAMSVDATSGAKEVDDIIRGLSAAPAKLDALEQLLVAETQDAQPNEYFVMNELIAHAVLAIVVPRSYEYDARFAEYFLRVFADSGILHLNRWIDKEHQAENSHVIAGPSQFSCLLRGAPDGADGDDDSTTETLEQELARLRTEYGTGEEELQHLREEQERKSARISVLEQQVQRERMIGVVVEETMRLIAAQSTDATMQHLITQAVARHLMAVNPSSTMEV